MLLSQTSIKRPVFSLMMNLAIIIFGFLAYQKIGIDTQPKVDLPNVNIRVQAPGSTPKFIENNILRPIELSLRSLSGIDSISSTVTLGDVNISVVFNLEENIDTKVNNIRNAIAAVSAKSSWPSNATLPTVKPVNMNMAPIFQIAVSLNNQDIGELSQYINEVFTPKLEQVSGVGDVGISGLRLPQVGIFFDKRNLNALGVSASDVVSQIKNKIASVPGGSIGDGKLAYNIDTSTVPSTLEELAAMPIVLNSGQTIRLSDCATVKYTVKELTTYSESDGNPAIILYVSKASDANTVEVAQSIRKVVNELSHQNDFKAKIRIVNDQSTFISESLSDRKSVV